MEWKKQTNKLFFFKLKSNNGIAYYTGIIHSYDPENKLIHLIDKFANLIGCKESEIYKYKQEDLNNFWHKLTEKNKQNILFNMKNISHSKPKKAVVPQGTTIETKSY